MTDELEHLFSSLDLKALVFGADFAAAVTKVAPRVATLRLRVQVGTNASLAEALDYGALLASGEPVLDDPGRSDSDLYLLCTGGTTGLPRASCGRTSRC